jgi:GT2 family glycosyltransferase
MELTSSIDVVVCTYADERWGDLRRALESVERQTLRAAKVVLVVDRNPGLVERASRTFDGLEVVPSANGGGLSAARNTGLARCTADVVAFLDDDAVADSRWLERLANEYADADALGVGGRIEPSWATQRPRWFPEEFDWVVGCTYRGMPETRSHVRNLIGANMSARRDVLAALGGFSAELGRLDAGVAGHEDTELCIRALAGFDGRCWVYAPDACVTHAVPASRARWRYFISRCYGEGRSKAAMTRLTGADLGLQSERSYVLRVLPAGVGRGLLDVLRGDPSGALRSAAILIGAALTALGYARGLLSSGGL